MNVPIVIATFAKDLWHEGEYQSKYVELMFSRNQIMRVIPNGFVLVEDKSIQ